MKIPKSICIMGENVKVQFVKDWSDHPAANNETAGIFYPSTMTIYLDRRCSRATQERFFLHEVGHAICFITGISQTAPNEMEEVIVQSFASFFFNQGKNIFVDPKRKKK